MDLTKSSMPRVLGRKGMVVAEAASARAEQVVRKVLPKLEWLHTRESRAIDVHPRSSVLPSRPPALMAKHTQKCIGTLQNRGPCYGPPKDIKTHGSRT